MASERRTDMDDMRKCIGSAKFSIAAHQAPLADFPAQPSQKDGLGRMCKPHWTEYTRALRKAALARKAADAAGNDSTVTPPAVKPVREKRPSKPEPIRTKPARGRKTESDAIVEEAPEASPT
jgi:hypothetical protein